MKRTLLFIVCVLASLTMSAQEELAVEDIQNSGCLATTRGEEYAEPIPTIVLTKEGSILSVQILNYESQCATAGFNVKNSISEGSNSIPSLTINVFPYDNGLEADCICPFNVSFTVRDLETNTFYLKCWWYEGLVTLKEGEPLVLEDITLYATLDGAKYTLKKTLGTATLTKVVKQKTVMRIPVELDYEGQTYAVKTIAYNSFRDCTTIKKLDIPESVSTIYSYSFYGCKLDTLIIRGILDPLHLNNDFFSGMGTDTKLYVQPSEVEKYKAIYEGPVYPLTEAQDDYRPLVEDGKVWAVKVYPDGYGFIRNDTWMQHFYFDGDTIVGGQTCKRMFYITNADEENWVNGVFTPGSRAQLYEGAWYEHDKKVYCAFTNRQQFELLYDFTLSSNDSIFLDGPTLVVDKTTGGIPGFKGTYYNFRLDWDNSGEVVERWLEGVGSDSWPWLSHPYGFCGHQGVLLSCSVGDEVIYYNSEEEDPYVMGARKNRFDFTHTIKTQPKAPASPLTPLQRARGTEREENQLYGEYNELLLDINLDPLDDAYLVRITNETSKVVYEKAINASSIVGLNIDISAFAEGRYTVTVENSHEIFIGEFVVQTTGISDALRNDHGEMTNDNIYNLQGQRISSLQKGLNIVNGQKVLVK